MIIQEKEVEEGQLWQIAHSHGSTAWIGRITIGAVSGEYIQSYVSENGIIKAGAKYRGSFVQTKFLFGILSSIKYNFCDDNDE